MNLEEALNYRRAVRVFDKNKPLDPEKVKHCLELASLAPSSSNMQLWEFFQITRPELIARVAGARPSLASFWGRRRPARRPPRLRK